MAGCELMVDALAPWKRVIPLPGAPQDPAQGACFPKPTEDELQAFEAQGHRLCDLGDTLTRPGRPSSVCQRLGSGAQERRRPETPRTGLELHGYGACWDPSRRSLSERVAAEGRPGQRPIAAKPPIIQIDHRQNHSAQARRAQGY